MFGVIYLPHFELQAALRQHIDWAGSPVALLDDAPSGSSKSRKCQIVQINSEAKQSGVSEGMTAPQGQARCETLRFQTRSAAQEQISQDILLQWNASITPNLEATRPGVCTVDLRGTAYDKGLEERWAHACVKALAPLHLHPGIGIAATPDLALLAAQVATPILKITAQAEATQAFLHPFTIQALGAAPEIIHILNRWGIKTVGSLVKLPKQEVVRRLGKECLPVWERAQGRHSRLLHHFQPSSILTESMDLEEPIERLQSLIFILNRFLEQLTSRLENLYRVAETMVLDLRFDDGTSHHQSFRIPEPTRDLQRLFSMLFTHLENFQSPSPIIGLSLSISPTRSTHVQLSLFDTNLRDPNRFTETLSRLEALLGPDRVGTPVPTASHRPDSFRLEPFNLINASKQTCTPSPVSKDGLPLRRFRPPKPAQITITQGPQAEQRMRVAFANLHSKAHKTSGPWNNSGHWWDQTRWERQEWDIELASGGVYRVAYEANRWLVDGVYD